MAYIGWLVFVGLLVDIGVCRHSSYPIPAPLLSRGDETSRKWPGGMRNIGYQSVFDVSWWFKSVNLWKWSTSIYIKCTFSHLSQENIKIFYGQFRYTLVSQHRLVHGGHPRRRSVGRWCWLVSWRLLFKSDVGGIIFGQLITVCWLVGLYRSVIQYRSVIDTGQSYIYDIGSLDCPKHPI